MTPVALGFRASRGGATVVALAADANGPRLLLSSFLATATPGDRLSLEPFHLAAEMGPGPDERASAQAKAAVREGRKRQDALAAAGLETIVASLRKAGSGPVIAALLVNRAGWVFDLLEYSLAFTEHAAVAEGLAVREALRSAFTRLKIECAEIDEKSLPAQASQALGLEAAQLDSSLKALGATAGKPWRKEQKLACLAAWTAIVARA